MFLQGKIFYPCAFYFDHRVTVCGDFGGSERGYAESAIIFSAEGNADLNF
jgi:hypothetical protein